MKIKKFIKRFIAIGVTASMLTSFVYANSLEYLEDLEDIGEVSIETIPQEDDNEDNSLFSEEEYISNDENFESQDPKEEPPESFDDLGEQEPEDLGSTGELGEFDSSEGFGELGEAGSGVFGGFEDFEGSYNDLDNFDLGYTGEDFNYEEGEDSDPSTTKEEDEFISPRKTFQYSLSSEEYPTFVDTGIPYNEENLKKEDLKEVLKQISVATNAKLASDENRFIILANENFAVLEGDSENVETIINAFKEVGVDLRVQSSRSGHKFNLAEQLERNGEIKAEVNGREVDLITSPEIDDSRVLLPIKSIGTALGADVHWDKGSRVATVKKDDITIKFSDNSNIVTVNGEEFEIGKSATITNDTENLLSLVNIVVDKLGAEMKWSVEDEVLKITNEIKDEIDDSYY